MIGIKIVMTCETAGESNYLCYRAATVRSCPYTIPLDFLAANTYQGWIYMFSQDKYLWFTFGGN